MFTSVKKEVRRYLEQKTGCGKSPFDLLLSEYLDGALKDTLLSAGIRKIDIYVDWHEDMKCIGIQGRYNEYYMDLQIYPDVFSISFDPVEPDEDVLYPLESKEQLYRVLSDTVKAL